MSNKSEASADRAAQLSALMDGELEADALAALCDDWRRDPDMRMRWHSYQLVGDVLRSDDLASTAGRDAEFLNRLRLRLEAEPVVLAPRAPAAPVVAPPNLRPARPWRAWRSSAAVAAGFVVVAVGAVSLMRPQSVGIETAAVPAQAPAAAVFPAQGLAVTASSRQNSGSGANGGALNGTLIRDARLDQYLAAHQQLAGGSLLGGHAAFLRQAATDAPRR